MQINLKNHRANIFEKNPYDEKKVSIVFVPGAGMDHRIISMFDLEDLYEEYNILGRFTWAWIYIWTYRRFNKGSYKFLY